MSNGIGINEVSAPKHHGESAIECGDSTSPVSPIKRLKPSESPTELDLILQYDIVQALLDRSSAMWSNAAAAEPFDVRLRPVPQSDPEMVYLVSRYWWDSFHKAYLHAKDPAVTALGIEYSMGPVDNQTLLANPVYGATRRRIKAPNSTSTKPRLKIGSNVLEGTDFICVPRQVRENCLVEW